MEGKEGREKGKEREKRRGNTTLEVTKHKKKLKVKAWTGWSNVLFCIYAKDTFTSLIVILSHYILFEQNLQYFTSHTSVAVFFSQNRKWTEKGENDKEKKENKVKKSYIKMYFFHSFFHNTKLILPQSYWIQRLCVNLAKLERIMWNLSHNCHSHRIPCRILTFMFFTKQQNMTPSGVKRNKWYLEFALFCLLKNFLCEISLFGI